MHAIQNYQPCLFDNCDKISGGELDGNAVREHARRPPRTVPPITPVGRDQRLPLSFAQQRLWFLDQLEPGSVDYNEAMPVRLGGALDVRALGTALSAVTARHEVLRTRLVAGTDGVPYQVVDPPAPFPLPVADVSGTPDPVAAARRLVAADTVAPFDLAGGPLIRGCLIRLAPGDDVLALSAHHVVFDEWSGGILRRELAALYEAFGAGAPDPLPPLPVQYADFAVWQREWLTGEVLEGQLDYWRKQLAGVPVLELPADRPRPSVRSTAGALTEFAVPSETAGRLRAVAREVGATMFMTLLAGFTVLLGRYSGQDDVVVGTPVANRNRAETEGLVGFFVNTLVLRADLSGDPTFTELLGRVRRMALNAYGRQDLPFEQLVGALVSERDRSRTPLFQVMFTYGTSDPLPGESGPGGGPGNSPAEIWGWSAAKFDLRLIMTDEAGGLAGGIEYSTALFDAARIERMAGHLVTLLEAVAADPRRPLSQLPVLTGDERERLAAWNDTAAPVPGVGGVHELIAARAEACPDAVAVTCGGRWLTYGALLRRAGRLAHYLRGKGVGPETIVALLLDRGLDMVLAVLAVWLAQGAYLPLDPDYPPERLGFMLADSRARVLVGRRERAGGTAAGLAGDLAAVWLDDPSVRDAVAAAPVAPIPVTDGRQLAYVIYTSGSTGRPKGVLAGHRGLVNRLAWMQQAYRLSPGERVLHKTPVTFDVSVWELVWPLMAGGCQVIAEPGRHGDPGYLADLVETHQVAVTHFVPSMFHQFVRHDWAAPLRNLRLVVCSGEALAGEDVARLYARHPTVRIENLYGPTEASIDVSWWSCERPDLEDGVPIGRPIANTGLYVLDRYLGPTPVGVPGELAIGGVGLARGYLGRAALTAERFVADPFAADGSRMYRTGDLARSRADGVIEFLGRIDHQVKVRGFRVEPGEIETVLTAHPAVHTAVVAADTDERGQRLVAWLLPADPASGIPDVGELRQFVASRLPEFMVPSVFTELQHLPLTPSGKLDRAALPAPGESRPDLAERFVAPSAPGEELVAGIWAQVLGTDRIGIHDNFFELGGHSLLATQVISRVREVFGTEVPLAALFDQPTVAELTALIKGAGRGLAVSPVAPVGRGRPLPLSFAQQRLWFLDQLEPGSAEYNMLVPVRLGGELDVAALGAALGALTTRHEVLRTRLVTGSDGVPYQVIDPPAPFWLPVADVSGTPDPVTAARELVAADVAAAFDLAGGPLIRGCVIRLDAGEDVLALSAHHVVFDDWSAGIFERELAALYEAFGAGEPDPLSPLPVQYADFAVWQREWLTAEVLEGQLAYWREQLAGVPVLELPADRPRPPVRSTAGALTGFAVPAEVAAGLRAVAREAGATMFMVSFAAFAVLLARYTGLDDVVAGTPVANRNRAETEGLIGFFVNDLVLRADLSGDPSFTELLARVRRTALDAYAHQDLPFEQLVEELVTERDRSRTPLFQVAFRYVAASPAHDASKQGAHLDGAAGTGRLRDNSPPEMWAWTAAKFDVGLILADQGGGLAGGIEYSTGLFDEATVGRLAGHLVMLLGAVAADPGVRVGDLPVLTAGEREELLGRWNETGAAVPAAGGAGELVAAAAAGRPDAVAVVAGGRCLTYGALMVRAGRLASVLRGAGVGAESVVGLCLERGAEMVSAMVGVWLAGACVPAAGSGVSGGAAGVHAG